MNRNIHAIDSDGLHHFYTLIVEFWAYGGTIDADSYDSEVALLQGNRLDQVIHTMQSTLEVPKGGESKYSRD